MDVDVRAVGLKLEELRQVAKIDLPRMANEYSGITQRLREGSLVDGALRRSEEFGAPTFEPVWTALRDFMWTVSDQTSDSLFALAEGLNQASDQFQAADDRGAKWLEDARRHADLQRRDFEKSTGPQGSEVWKKRYENTEGAPNRRADSIPPGAGGR